MEFSFDINDVATFDNEGFAILDSTKMNPRSTLNTSPYYLQQYSAPKKSPTQEKLAEILDKIGDASSKVPFLFQKFNFVGSRTEGYHYHIQ
jgi:hypothetical protein